MTRVTKEMQREFWKHNINPITGWVVDRNLDEQTLRKSSKDTVDRYFNHDFSSEITEEDIEDVPELDCSFDETFEELMNQIED